MGVLKSDARVMGRILRTCLWPVLLVLTIVVAKEAIANAQERFVPGVGRLRASAREGRGEFVLHAPADRVAAIAARHGLTVIRALNDHDVFLVRGRSGFGRGRSGGAGSDEVALQQLKSDVQSDPDVEEFELNSLVVTPELASDLTLNQSTVEILDGLPDRTLVPYFGNEAWIHYVNQSATSAIHLAESHGAGGTGAGIIAIIDTGVDPNHPVLQGSLVPGYDFTRDIAGDASEWADVDQSTVEILDQSTVEILDQQAIVHLNSSTVAILDQATAATLNPASLPPAFGHGTMVAGLVHLVAPSARIMPLKAFSADGTSTVFDIVRAINYAVEHGARIVNMSFSATAVAPEIAHAINEGTNRGVIFVASAGNLGQEVLVYPGALRNVLGIGSTGSHNPATRSTFSNYGDGLVSLGAPGEAVITTYPGGGYAGVWGTSFSAPLTTGGAALLLQVDPTLDHTKAAALFGKADSMPAGMGKGRLNLYEALRTLPDSAPPEISLLTPVNGSVLSGSTGVSASATDNIAVAGVKFLLDDNQLGAEDTTAPYEVAWNTAEASEGVHTLMAVARDAAGNQTTAMLSVTVANNPPANDTTAPTVTLTSPAAGTTLAGPVTVTVTASAADDVGVVGVEFLVDGTSVGTVSSVPYEVAWSTETVANGPHVLAAVARDAAGNETATTLSVTVVNEEGTPDTTPPTVTLTNPTTFTTLAGMLTVTAAATDDVGVVGVEFLVDGTAIGTVSSVPYATVWHTGTVANGAHVLAARAWDAAGHQTVTTLNVMVLNDTTAPTVTLTSPAAGATVGGLVTMTAAATDDVGVLSVEFQVDGTTVGTAPSAPYEAAWPTETVADGPHVLAAIARDAVGHETVTTLSVIVAND